MSQTNKRSWAEMAAANLRRTLLLEVADEFKSFLLYGGESSASEWTEHVNELTSDSAFRSDLLATLTEEENIFKQNAKKLNLSPFKPLRMFDQVQTLDEFKKELQQIRIFDDRRKVSLLCYNAGFGFGKTTWTNYLAEQTDTYNIFCIPNLTNPERVNKAYISISKAMQVAKEEKARFFESFAKYAVHNSDMEIDKCAEKFIESFRTTKEFCIPELTDRIDSSKDVIFLYDEATARGFQKLKNQFDTEFIKSCAQSQEVFLFEHGVRSNGARERFPLSGSDIDPDDESALTTLSRAFIDIMDVVAKALQGHKNKPVVVCCASGVGYFPIWVEQSSSKGSTLVDTRFIISHSSTRKLIFKTLLYTKLDCRGKCSGANSAPTDSQIRKMSSQYFCCFLYSEVVEMLERVNAKNNFTEKTLWDELLSTILATAQYLTHSNSIRIFRQDFLTKLQKSITEILFDAPNDSHSHENQLAQQILSAVRKKCHDFVTAPVIIGLSSQIQTSILGTETEMQTTIAKILLAGISGVAVDTTRPLVRCFIKASLFVHLLPSGLGFKDINSLDYDETSQFSASMALATMHQLSRLLPANEQYSMSHLVSTVCTIFNNNEDFSDVFERVAFAHMHLVFFLLSLAFPSGAVFNKQVLHVFSSNYNETQHKSMRNQILRYFSLPTFMQWNSFPSCKKASCDECRQNDNATRYLCKALCIRDKVYKVTKLEQDTNGTCKDVQAKLNAFLKENPTSGSNVNVLLCKGTRTCPGFDGFVAVLTTDTLYLFLCEAKSRLADTDCKIKANLRTKVHLCMDLLVQLELDLQQRGFQKFFVLQAFGSPTGTVCSLFPSPRPEGSESARRLEQQQAIGLNFLVRQFKPGDIGYLPTMSVLNPIRLFPDKCVLFRERKNNVGS